MDIQRTKIILPICTKGWKAQNPKPRWLKTNTSIRKIFNKQEAFSDEKI